MSSSIFLLLAIFHYAGQKRIDGRKKLQKLVCILKYGYNIPFSYDFRPYYYGPYSEDLTDAVDTLIGLRVLMESKKTLSSGIVKYMYELTPQGKEKAKQIIKNIQDIDLDRFKKLIKELNDKQTRDLVLESKRVSPFYS